MNKRVLIADDEPNIVISLEFLMKREGHAVSVARDGVAALEAIRRERPALVLLDVMMPGELDGLQVCHHIKNDAATRDIRVVLLTARGQARDREVGREAGADEYLVKPFSPLQLIETIERLLVLP